MSIKTIIFQSIKHYKKAHLLLALGIALSTAVITGALIVGDSVSHSLVKATQYRLAKVQYALTAGDRFFPKDLAHELSRVCDKDFSSLLSLNAKVSSDGGKRTVSNAQIWGVDSGFDSAMGTNMIYDSIPYGSVLISENLAMELGVEIGEEILLKIRKASVIPLNAPFVSADDQIVNNRVLVHGIVAQEQGARWSLQNTQTAPYNVFVNIDWLNSIMDLKAKANLILTPADTFQVVDFQKIFSLYHAGIEIDSLDSFDYLTSERVFISDAISKQIMIDYEGAEPYLTYFVNALKHKDLSCPYSFVSTQQALNSGEIIINEWLAADLDAKRGDTIRLDYYVVGNLRQLDSANASFIVKDIINQDQYPAYRLLMPNLPGLSDAGNCKDWETGVPIDLDAIRDKDEAYWNTYKGTPKAFIPLSQAENLWKNRFGTYTTWKVKMPKRDSFSLNNVSIDPFALGFELRNVKEEGLYAAQNGTEFYSLFIGLSFFIILAGLILSALLFLFSIDQRKSQIGSFRALGFSVKQIQSILIKEVFLVGAAGGLLGLVLALFYTHLVFWGLNGIWQDIVRTQVLEVYINPLTLLYGLCISLFISMIIIHLSLRRTLKVSSHKLQQSVEVHQSKWIVQLKMFGLAFSLIIPLFIILWQLVFNEKINEGFFFMSGTLLLIGFLLGLDMLFIRLSKHNSNGFSLSRLSFQNMLLNRRRSLMLVTLLSLGSFLVVSTGANRKDLFSNASSPKSGTGGFDYFMESSIPILNQLNSEKSRMDFSLKDSLTFIQMRRLMGDDASCLNLNRISRPMLLGLNPKELYGHFDFATLDDLADEDNPWKSLEESGQAYIPAIADQTVIKWSLGKQVGDTLIYHDEAGEEIYLKLIAGLKASVFQGYVLIAEENFIKHYPSSSGSSVFLIDGDTNNLEEDLNLAFKDHGLQITPSANRLATFKSVENTYLSIFLILGAFGLLIGTFGLAVVVARSLLERRAEIAIYRAIGYSSKHIFMLIFKEYTFLFIIGLVGGTLSAFIAVLPALIGQQGISLAFIACLIFVLLLNGIIWIAIIAKQQLRKVPIRNNLID